MVTKLCLLDVDDDKLCKQKTLHVKVVSILIQIFSNTLKREQMSLGWLDLV